MSVRAGRLLIQRVQYVCLGFKRILCPERVRQMVKARGIIVADGTAHSKMGWHWSISTASKGCICTRSHSPAHFAEAPRAAAYNIGRAKQKGLTWPKTDAMLLPFDGGVRKIHADAN
jgi:hypothetical protein